MCKQLQKIERNAIIITSDSGDSINTRKIWLLDRTISIVWREYRQIVNEESIYQGIIGRWNGFQMSKSRKKILVITACRLPEEIAQGIYVQRA